MQDGWTGRGTRVCCAWPSPSQREPSAGRDSEVISMPATDTNVMAPAGRLPPRPLIEGPSAWIGSDMRRREAEWSYRLSPPQVVEIESAVRAARARGLDIAEIS